MRIAVLTQGYFTAGGVQSVARWIVRGMRGLGHEVHVHELGGHPAGLAATQERARAEGSVTVWRPRLHASDPARYLPLPGLARALDTYDVVQVVAGGPALALVAGGTRTPMVLQVATRLPWERAALRDGSLRDRALWLQSRLVGVVEPAALRRADVVLVENPALLAEARRLGAREVLKAPPGVDVHRFTPRPEGTDPKGPFLSVCRLWEPRKGLDRMIDAYADLVATTGEPRHLVLAGRGQLHPAARASLERHGLEHRVEVRADVSAEALPAIYRSASQFWQASYEEGLGISVLEAMASGLPVVSTVSAGAQECVRDGVTGVLVPQEGGDSAVVRAWSAAVSRATGCGLDMGRAARARAVSEFSDEATLARYDEVYRRLVAGGDRG